MCGYEVIIIIHFGLLDSVRCSFAYYMAIDQSDVSLTQYARNQQQVKTGGTPHVCLQPPLSLCK